MNHWVLPDQISYREPWSWANRVSNKAYETGKALIVFMWSRTEIEETKTGRERIIVTEFPYMVNKTKVVLSIIVSFGSRKTNRWDYSSSG